MAGLRVGSEEAVTEFREDSWETPVLDYEPARLVRLRMNEQNPEYFERYGFDELREERRYLLEMRIANSMWEMVDPELDVLELEEPERCIAFYDYPGCDDVYKTIGCKMFDRRVKP